MGADTKIQWTDYTFNPWWGCVRVSPGCENCYAERDAKRYGHSVWGVQSERRFFGDHHWSQPVKWNREAQAAGVRRRVFCASMADVFEDRRDLDGWRAKLWPLIECTTSLDWQLLTKRPENVHRLVPTTWMSGGWPKNAWLGFTAEDQARLEARYRHARVLPSPVKYVSYEPALEGIRFRPEMLSGPDAVSWVIIGGESGPGARPFSLGWAVDVIEQCRAAGVAPFYKQGGASNRCPHDAKGGHFECFAPALQVREFPQ